MTVGELLDLLDDSPRDDAAVLKAIEILRTSPQGDEVSTGARHDVLHYRRIYERRFRRAGNWTISGGERLMRDLQEFREGDLVLHTYSVAGADVIVWVSDGGMIVACLVGGDRQASDPQT